MERMNNEPNQPDEQPVQWVAVPPPHPYATSSEQGAGSPQRGNRALAIAAMALGLVALLTVLVSAFYFDLRFALSGGIIGIVAVVLGTIALVVRSRPMGAAVVGTAVGGVAVIAAAVLALAGTFSQLALGESPGTDPQESEDTEEQWTPETEQESLLTWPANMETGGIVFTAPESGAAAPDIPVPVHSAPPAASTPPAERTPDRQTSNDVVVYVDYSCPHCALFEERNGEFLRGLAASGEATVEIVPLSFMDRGTAGSYYSSRAAGAMACLADSQPEAAWHGNSALLDSQVQPNGGAGMSNDEIISLLDRAVGGLNEEARSCIGSERFVSFAQSFNQWAFANPVSGAEDTESRLQGTPTIFVNGVYFGGSTDDAAAFAAFYEEQKN